MEARKVILAGIADDKMDLFLLLNEGAGYKVTGIVDRAGRGETTQIAEILGVRTYADSELDRLPPADIVIYGDESYRSLGQQLGLPSRSVWHQTDAWNYLTEAERPGRVDESARAPDADTNGGSSSARGAEAEKVSTAPTPAATSASEPSPARAALDADGLHALSGFSRSLGDLEQLYGWVLARAIATTGAVAGGVMPSEALRPAVWQDRRAEPSGRRPAFLAQPGPGDFRMRMGAEGQAGASELVLVGARARGTEIEPLVGAVGPALQMVAELEDLRRTFAQETLVRAVLSGLDPSADKASSLESVCRAIASNTSAQECLILFADAAGERFEGVSSRGGRVSIPAGSALLGGGPTAGSAAAVDASGRWQYLAEIGHASKRGVLGLYGVPASAGRGESMSHEVAALARALGERLAELAGRPDGGHV